MSAIKPHAVGIERLALFHVLEILESKKVGYPPELKDVNNPIIEEARVTLVFELAFMATKCLVEAAGGFNTMTIWMKCENSPSNTEGAIAARNADSVVKETLKIKSKYYNIIKLLLLGDFANPNQTEKHSIEFKYTPLNKIWIKDTDKLTNIVPLLIKTRQEYINTQMTLGINSRKMREYASTINDIKPEDKFKHYLQKYYHTGTTIDNRKHFLSSSQHWWIEFTNKLAESLNETCTNKSEQILIRLIDKDKLQSAIKTNNHKALTLDAEIERRCKLAYTSNQNLGALGQDDPKTKLNDRQWFINKISNKAREQDVYIEKATSTPSFQQHPDYKNFFSPTPFIELRHIQTVALCWIFAKADKNEFNFKNPLTFIKNNIILEKILSIERPNHNPINQQGNNTYISKIISSFHHNNPEWPEIIKDLHEFLYAYISLSPERRSELYSKIISIFLNTPESIEEWLHLPLNPQDPIEFISTRPSEDIARDLIEGQKDGDFTEAFIANSELYNRFAKLTTTQPTNIP